MTPHPATPSPPDPRALREHLGLSQRGAARRFGVRRQTIIAWDAGGAPQSYLLALEALVLLRALDPPLAARLLETAP